MRCGDEATGQTREIWLPSRTGSRGNARHDMTRDGGIIESRELFPHASEDTGITALEAHDPHALPCQTHHQRADLILRHTMIAAGLADVVALTVNRQLSENLTADQTVIDHLATSEESDRIAAVENHCKWVDAAAAMGCHSVRVNLNGSSEPETWIPNSVDGLRRLATYASDKNINVLVENHGGLSSNASLLVQVMREVGMDNCGTLPDFGNFCISEDDSGCLENYDRYKGVEELMPYAKAVSAKSNNFDVSGNETGINYLKMLEIVKDAGYNGFIGVEYEGSELGEEAGIIATRDLLLKVAKQIS